jgi:RimJ/RimL family protein N-acetyltransferase
MVALSPVEYARVLPLLEHPLLSLESRSVARGHSPGWVYVDSAIAPQIALIWSQGIEGYYLAGDPQAEGIRSLNRFIDAAIAPRGLAKGMRSIEISGCSPEWERPIHNVFAERDLRVETMLIYGQENQDLPASRPIANASSFHQIDHAFLANPPCDDTTLLDSKLALLWEDLDTFERLGTGFCIIRDAVLVSVCLTAFTTDDVHLIDIETLKDYQGNGFAYHVARSYLAHCLHNELTLYWGCMESNTASAKLAERLGFVKVLTYPLYSFSI